VQQKQAVNMNKEPLDLINKIEKIKNLIQSCVLNNRREYFLILFLLTFKPVIHKRDVVMSPRPCHT
jgi:hypothetical protein